MSHSPQILRELEGLSAVKAEVLARERVSLKGMKGFGLRRPERPERYGHICLKFSTAHLHWISSSPSLRPSFRIRAQIHPAFRAFSVPLLSLSLLMLSRANSMLSLLPSCPVPAHRSLFRNANLQSDVRRDYVLYMAETSIISLKMIDSRQYLAWQRDSQNEILFIWHGCKKKN